MKSFIYDYTAPHKLYVNHRFIVQVTKDTDYVRILKPRPQVNGGLRVMYSYGFRVKSLKKTYYIHDNTGKRTTFSFNNLRDTAAFLTICPAGYYYMISGMVKVPEYDF